MTRKKKSRSLKRIHSVKTGNISKLKRAGTVDRQNSNLKAKAKPKSVYQKFLDENPEAAEKQVQVSSHETATSQTSAKDSTTEDNKKAIQSSKSNDAKANETKAKRTKSDPEKESSKEREPDLLSQLDNKNFNDFY